MNKGKQIVVLLLFIGLSFIYQKYQSKITLSEIEEINTQLSITIEGAIEENNRTIVVDHVITIEEALSFVNVKENAALHCLNYDKELYHNDFFYIPYQEDILVSLNNSGIEELTKITGIGEATARKIIEYRDGKSFTCVEDIMEITGIKEKKYLKYRKYLCI